MSNHAHIARATPLTDLLRNVPLDARMTYEHARYLHQTIPVGRLCAEALAEIERLRHRVECLRGLCKSATGALHDAGADDEANKIFALIGDMEPPLTPNVGIEPHLPATEER